MKIHRPSIRTQLVLQPSLLALALASCFPGALANPLDPTVGNGSAVFQQHGSTLTITNSPNAIIDWRSFSIGAGEVTRFIQQSSASQVLNRVVGGDPSQILGTLQSNGRVFLINPNGIVFGRDAVVDVAGLVASTLNLSNADFLAGKLRFGGNAGGVLRNDGMLRATGDIYLIAPTIENNGVIHAPDGSVLLAAGKTVSLVDMYRPDVMVDITAPANEVVNVGTLVGGHIGIYAGAIRNEGKVYANSAVIGGDGAIVFKAKQSVTLAAGSTTSASGTDGAGIVIEGGDSAQIAGAVESRGISGVGGRIHVTANQVTVAGTGAIDASGQSGGGEIAIGGGLRGTDGAIANANTTTLEAGSVVRADALDRGTGGTITVWSESVTQASGSISARGGARGGDGGFVETSSRGQLVLQTMPDVSAAFGAGGTWLIDPFNITVIAGSGLTNNGGAPGFTPSGTSSIGADLIAAALTNNTNVVLDTTGPGLDAGNIAINSQIVAAPTAATTLTLNAHNNIDISAAIRSTGAALNLSLRADQDAAGGGAATVSAAVNLAGGTLSFLGAAAGTFGNGTALSNATVTAPGAAALTVSGTTANFANVTLNADLLVPNATRLNLTGGLTVGAGRAVTVNSTDGSFTSLEFNGTQSLLGGGTVRFTGAGNNANLREVATNGILTIGPGVTVVGTATGTINAAGTGTSIVNQGTIVANTATKTITINGNFENQGTVRVDGGNLILNGNWNNDSASAPPGTIDITANGGALGLDGTFSTSQFGNFTRANAATAGTVTISGVMNVPTTFLLDSSKGTFILNGGAIIGVNPAASTLSASGTGTLVVNGSTNLLSGITMDTDVSVTNGTVLTVRNDLAIAAGRTLTVNSADFSSTRVDFDGTQTFSGGGAVRFTGAGNNANLREIATNGVLTIGPNVTVSNAASGAIAAAGTGSSIVNQGTLIANTANKILTISGNFENQGTVRVDGGSLTLSGAWTNDGATATPGTLDITANGGTLTLGGTFGADQFGNFTRAAAGTAGIVNITGTMTVPTLFLLDSAKGVFNLRGGTISGAAPATSILRSSGTGGLAITTGGNLSGITLDTDTTVANGTRVTVTNGLGVASGRTVTIDSTDGSFTALDFDGTQTLSGAGTVRFTGTGNNANLREIGTNGVLTIGNGVSVANAGNASISAAVGGSSIVNQGKLIADTAGKTLTIAGNFENQGTVRVDAGIVSLTGAWNNDGATAPPGTLDITANGGTLNLAGSFNADQFGNFTRANAATAGTVNITGTMTVPTLFTLDSAKGIFNLNGSGSIVGAGVATSTLRTAGTGGLAINGPGNLSGITLDADTTISDGQRVTVTNGLGIASGRTITVNSVGGGFTSLDFDGTQTLSGAGAVHFTGAGNNANLREIATNGVLTIGNGVTVAASGFGSVSAAVGGSSIINQGTLVADTAGKTLSIAGNFENQGTVRVDGGNVSLTGAWNNDGAAAPPGTLDITANGGTLNLAGSFNADQFGNFTRANAATAGTVNITGTMTVPTLFTLDSAKGIFNLNGSGSIVGAGVATSTLRTAGTGGLAINGPGNLSGITLDADTTISDGQRVTVTNGLGIASGRTITVNSVGGGFTSLDFDGTQTLSGAGAVHFTGAGNNANLREIATNGVLTIGNGVTVAASGFGSVSAAVGGSSITNQGTLVADTAGKTLTIAGNFENQGTVRVDGGNVSLIGAWNNDGATAPPGTLDMTANGGTLTLGGTFNATQLGILNRANAGTAGTLNLTGTMNNAANTFVFDSAKGVVNLINGTISGGTLQQSGTGALAVNTGGTLANGVTLDMNLSINNTQLDANGGLTIAATRTVTVNSTTGAFTSLNFNGGGAQTLGGGGTVLLTGAGGNANLRPIGGVTATIGPNITVRAAGNSAMSGDVNNTITNLGTIVADTPGVTLGISAPFTNTAPGKVNIAGGNITTSNLVSNTGQITVSGGTYNIAGTNWDSTGGNIAINGGTVNLGGTFAGTQFANISRSAGGTAGTVNLNGTLNNAGKTFVFDSPKGVINLVNGTISGGTLQQAGSGALAINAPGGGTLANGVTLDMDLSINNVQVDANGGLNVAANRILTVNSTTGAFTSLNFNGGGAQTLGGGGTVLLTGAGGNANLRPLNGVTATIGQNITVRASGNSAMSGDVNNTIVNQGTIVADAPGTGLNISAPLTNAAAGRLNIAGGNITTSNLLSNTGQITVSNGIYNLSGNNWDLSGGNLALTGGVLNLGGTFAGTQFANITRAGGGTAGTVNLTGTLNNTGNTFVFDSPKGVVNLVNGTINGGTLQQAGTGAFAINAPGGGTLANGVTLDMDLSINNVQIDATGGLNVAANRTLTINSTTGAFTSLNFNGGGAQTLGGSGTVLLTGAGGNANLRPLNGVTATIGQNITVRASGNSAMSGDVNNTIVNQGTIVADTPGTGLNISAPFTNAAAGKVNIAGGNITTSNLLSNTGQITVSNGIYSIAGTNWDSTGGNIAINGGTVNLGGTFAGAQFANITRGAGGTAGTVNLTGTMNNAGSTFVFDSPKGLVNLVGGTINGGTLQQSGTGLLAINAGSNGNLTNGVTLDMDLAVNNTQLTAAGDLTILSNRTLTVNAATGAFTALNFDSTGGSRTLGGGGTVVLTGAGGNANFRSLNGTATIAPGMTIRYDGSGGLANGGGGTSLINQGTITLNGATTTVSVANLINQGTIALFGGATFNHAGSAFTNPQGGTIGGVGTIAATTFTNNGTLRAGNSPGLLKINGDLVLGATSITEVEIAGSRRGTDYDAIDVSGSVTLGGTANVVHLPGYNPVDGDTFLVISAVGGVSGNFDAFTAPVAYNRQIDPNSVVFQVGGTVTPVLFWNTDNNGSWTVAANWNQKRLPTDKDIVIIDRGAANPIVSIDVAGQLANQLRSDEQIVINAPGSLTLSGPSTITGSLTLNGGQLNYNGALTLGTVTVNSASLGGAPDLIVTGPAAFNGATLTGAGAMTFNGTVSMINATLNGTGLLTTNGATTITGAVGDAKNWTNNGALALNGNGQITIVNNAVLTNTASATIALNGTSTILLGNSSGGLQSRLDNAGTLTIASTAATPLNFNFSGGPGTVNNTGTIDKTSAATQNFDLRTAFNNTGTLKVEAGTLSLDNGSGAAASSVVDITGGATLVVNGGTSTFSDVNGTGTLRLANGTLNFNNAFTFNATTPALQITGGTLGGTGDLAIDQALNLGSVTLTGTGAFATNATTTVTGLVTDAKNWTNNGALALNGTGQITIVNNAVLTNAATATIDLNGTSAILLGNSSGGLQSRLDNAGTLTIASTAATPLNFNFSGGPGTVNNTGTIDKTSAATQNFASNVTFNNTGTLKVEAGTLSLDDGSGAAASVVDITGGATLVVNGGTSTFSDVNGTGTLRLANGTLNFNNAFTFDATTPALQITGGTLGGIGDLTINQALNLGTFTLTGTGAFITNAATAVTGAVTDARNWTNNGALALNGTGQITIVNNAVLTNTASATIDLNGTSAILLGNSSGGLQSRLDNAGTLTIASTAATPINFNFSGGPGTVNNTGTIDKTSAATQNFDLRTAFNNTGTLKVEAGTLSLDNGSGAAASVVDITGGATLVVNGGTSTFSDVNGTGTLRLANGTLNFNNAFTFDATTPALQITGGTLGGIGDLTIDQALNLGSVTLTGTGAFATNATTTVTGLVTDAKNWTNNGALALNGTGQITIVNNAVLTNAATATIDLNGTSAILLGNSSGGLQSRLDNAGTLTIASTAATPLNFNFSGGPGTVNNTGTIDKTSATTQNFASNVTFNNTGTLKVEAGTLSLDNGSGAAASVVDITGGATLVVNGGTSTFSDVNGTGTLRLANGTLNFDTAFTFDNTTPVLQATGGILGGAGDLTVNQALNLGSVFLNGTGRLTTNGTTTITGAVGDAKNWTNNGALALNGNGQITIVNNAVLTNTASATIDLNGTSAILLGNSSGGLQSRLDNAGTLTIASTAATPINFNFSGGTGTVNNTGTIDKTSAATQNFAGNVTFNNAGTLKVEAGRLNLDGSAALSGTVDVATNATLGLPAATTSSGRLQGTGTIVLGTGTGAANETLTNNGIIAPAGTGATGTLTINGNLTQGANGTTELEIAGTAIGQFDVLQVSGAANLNGTLNLVALGGYTGNPGDTFAALMTYSSHTGNPAINSPQGVNGTPALGATGLSFSIQSTIDCGGADVCWVGTGTTDNWNDLLNWSTRTLPTLGQSVFIDVPGPQTVTISDAAQAGSITVNEILTIATGGSLAVGGQATFNNGLNITGGIFNANGNTSITGLNLSAGAINVASGRTATLSGAAAWSGGTLAGTGSTVLVAPSSVLAMNGNIDHVLSGLNLGNAGAIQINGSSRLVINNNAVVTNTTSATIDLNGTSSIVLGGSSSPGTTHLDNAGVITIASTAPTVLDFSRFGFAGALNNTGTITKTSTATQNFANTVIFNNTGTLNAHGGTLSLDNGSGAGPGNVDVAAASTLIFNGGTSNNAATLASGSTLAVSAGTSDLSAITGAGTVRVDGGTLNLNSAVTFNGTTLALQVNGGTLGGTGAVTVDQALALNNATFAGTGALTTNGTTTIAGSVVDAGKPWNNNGAITLNGTAQNPAQLSVTSDAVLTNTANATIDLNGTSSIVLGGSSSPGTTHLDNAGVITIASTAPTVLDFSRFGFAGALNNTGTITKTSTATQNFANTVIFNNTGTLNAHSGTLSLDNGSGAGPGNVDVAAASTLIFNGGTSNNAATLASGSTLAVSAGTSDLSAITGAGTVRVDGGTLNLNSAVTFNGTTLALQVNGGTLGGTGAVTVDQALALNNATFAGTGALTTNGTTTIAGSVVDAGKPWNNNGAITLNGTAQNPAQLSVTSDAVLTNTANATIDLNGTSSIVLGGSSSPGTTHLDNAGVITIASTAPTVLDFSRFGFAGALNNTGTITKTSTATQNFANTVIFNNTGTLNVDAGRLNLDNGTALNGTVIVSGNAILGLLANTTSNGRLESGNTGFIVLGDGTGTLTNNGTIAPGGTGGLGQIFITGNLTQGPNGTTEVEFQNIDAGGFDQLNISGVANLGGELVIKPQNGSAATHLGESYPGLVNYSSHTGTYSTITVPSGANGTPTVGATAVSFAIPSAIDCGGADVCWVGTTGNWNDLANWSTRTLPTAFQSVLIDVPNTLETITISGGTQFAGSITVNEILTVSGGTFTVRGQATFNSGLNMINTPQNIAGGIFNSDGNVSINGLNLSAGAINIASGHTATLSGVSTWSGGALNGQGATLAIANTASLALTNGVDHILSGLVVNNAGNLSLALAGSRLLIDNGATLNNSGTVRFIGGADSIDTTQGGTLVNTGTIRNEDAGATATITNVVFSNSGGTLATTATSDLVINTSSTFDGTTTVIGDRVGLGGTKTFTDGAALNGRINLTGGASSFGDTIVNGILSNIGGGAMTVGAGKTLTIAGPGRGLFSATSFLGSGTVHNRGQLELDGVTLAGSLVNEGSLDIGAGATSVDGAVLTLSTGILNLGAGGTLTKTGGAASWNGGTITGTGSLVVAGGGTFALGGTDARVLDDPTLTVPTLTVPDGSLTLQSGALNVDVAGSTTISSGAALIRNGGSFNPGGGALVNNGTLTLANGDTPFAGGGVNTGTFNIRNATATIGGAFSNSGTFTLGTNGGLTIGAGGGFDNASSGTFTFAADSGNLSLNGQRIITNSGRFESLGGNHTIGNGGSAIFNNTPGGEVRVDGGRFTLLMNGSAPDHGAYTVASGASLEFPDQNRDFASDSSITGAGTIVFRAFSGGTINLDGNYHLTGTTQVQGNTTVLVGSGNTATTGTLDQSGGTLGGTGSLVVTNSFNRTGGGFGTAWKALDITHRTGDLSITSPLLASDSIKLNVTNGNLTVTDALVTAVDTLSVSARNISVVANTRAAALQGGDLKVTTTGDLSIRGGSAAESTAQVRSTANPCSGSIGGNLVVAGGTGSGANASFVGSRDIGSADTSAKDKLFSIGGEVRMTFVDGGGTARVASTSAKSIHLELPNQSSGGYFVNGAPVTSAGGSGFYAGADPALLNTNLFINYGKTATPAPTTDAAAVIAQTIVPPPTPPFTPARNLRAADETAEVVDNTKARPGECR